MAENITWLARFVNHLFGHYAAALLAALHVQPSNPELPIPEHVVMAIVVVILGTILAVVLRSRLSVEKPGAMRPVEIVQLQVAARQTAANVYIAYNRRFLASVRRAREIIEADGGLTSFTFDSTSYTSLVISGARAQYRGLGTINGAGSYAFVLTAIDGQVSGGGGTDKFRIKITNRTTGQVIYDNQMNAPDTADPTTVIGGGSIVIHR